MKIVLETITTTIGYDYVNISLVNPETRRIKTEYVYGFSDKDATEFKRMADHSLNSNDIQAHIVKTRQIEVPRFDDPRFDEAIQKKMRHNELIRVYIPMIDSADQRVIGTVEAGYSRRYRKHIYERDIRRRCCQ